MAAHASAPAVQAPRLFRSVERLRGALLWLTGFAGAIVFMEPSPYEVASLLTIFVFVCTGLTLRPGRAHRERIQGSVASARRTGLCPIERSEGGTLWEERR